GDTASHMWPLSCGQVQSRGFATGFQQDYAAVAAALAYEWSNGQVEGQVNKLKLIKRQMYGRAKLDLLKVRLLEADQPGRSHPSCQCWRRQHSAREWVVWRKRVPYSPKARKSPHLYALHPLIAPGTPCKVTAWGNSACRSILSLCVDFLVRWEQ